MEKFVESYLDKTKDLTVLDIGSCSVDHQKQDTYRNLIAPHWTYVGCDMHEGNNVDIVFKDPYDWKELEGQEFDVIISGQAFEHIEYPFETIKQMNKFLKSGGYSCIIAPFIAVEHQYPVDCWRFLPDGWRALCKSVGWEVLKTFYTDFEAGCCADSVVIARKP